LGRGQKDWSHEGDGTDAPRRTGRRSYKEDRATQNPQNLETGSPMEKRPTTRMGIIGEGNPFIWDWV